MKVIGITGGIGAGKSMVLSLLKEHYCCYIIQADEVAKDTMKKHQKGFLEVVELFGEEVLAPDGEIDRAKLAAMIFANKNKRMVINSIIHPLVKRIILEKINELRIAQTYDYVFVEAALLIEDHYQVICDELWYIYAEEEIRRKRLKESRGYSDDKITDVIASQLSEDEFKRACHRVIDNSGDISETLIQLQNALGGYVHG